MERGQGLVYAVKGHLKSTSKPVRLLFQSLYFIFDVWLFIMDSEAYSQTDFFFITGTTNIYLLSMIVNTSTAWGNNS